MSQIVTLYSDKERTDALYPRTKVSAISDDNNTPLKELMTGTVKQEEGGTEEEVVTPVNADTLGGRLTANNVVFYEEEMVDEFGQVVVKNADKLENHPASYFATSEELNTNSEELNTKANKSDVLTLEEIQASTDLTGKIASASSVKEVNNRIFSDHINSGYSKSITFSGLSALIIITRINNDVYAIYSVDHWSDTVKLIAGSSHANIILTTTASSNNLSISNNFGSAISVIVIS